MREICNLYLKQACNWNFDKLSSWSGGRYVYSYIYSSLHSSSNYYHELHVSRALWRFPNSMEGSFKAPYIICYSGKEYLSILVHYTCCCLSLSSFQSSGNKVIQTSWESFVSRWQSCARAPRNGVHYKIWKWRPLRLNVEKFFYIFFAIEEKNRFD